MARRPAGEQGRRQARAWALGAVALLLLVAVPAPASVLPDLSSNACENPLPRSVPVCEEWVTISATESVGRAEPFDSVMSADGSTVYAVGDLTHHDTGWDLFVVAYEVATGAERWTYRFDGGNGGIDRGFAITEDPATGDLFIAGETNPFADERDLLVLSLTSDGLERWVWTWSHAPGSEDLGRQVVLDAATNTLVVQGMVVWEDLGTLHGLDPATGAEQWTSIRPNESSIMRLADLPGPWVAALARVESHENFFDFGVSVHHAKTGKERWSTQWDRGLHSWDQPDDLVVSPDGGTLYATGSAIGFGTGFDIVVIGWNSSTGDELWNMVLDGGTPQDRGRAIAVSPDGDQIFSAGRFDNRLLIAAVAADTGELLWHDLYQDPWEDIRPRVSGFDSSHRSGGSAVKVSHDGSFVIVGGFSEAWRSPVQADRDMIVAGFGAGTGDQLWSNRFNGPGWDWDQGAHPGSLSRHPSQDLFVLLGQTESAEDEDVYRWAGLALRPSAHQAGPSS